MIKLSFVATLATLGNFFYLHNKQIMQISIFVK